jgi:NAD(P)-dependent dehydrogenase (short-subunit alcohol dehydrogenase family)
MHCRGYIITPMTAKAAAGGGEQHSNRQSSESSTVALKRPGQPGEAASLIAFLLGDESKFITGATYSIDGGWHC